MLFEELLKDEREVGRKEGIFKGMTDSLLLVLSKFGVLPDELHKKINEETDEEVLKNWIQTASQVTSLEEFISKM